MADWKTIMEFTQHHEALVAQSVLESEGVVTYLRDQMTIGMHNYFSPGTGVIKLQVPDVEWERSAEILKDAGYLHD